MTTDAMASPVSKPKKGLMSRALSGTLLPVIVVVLGIIAIWYVAAISMNSTFQRSLDARAEATPSTVEFVVSTLNQERPVLPSPHQVAENLWDTVFNKKITSKRSLVYHAGVTLAPTLLGFLMGTGLGILLATIIVHVLSMEKSLMPWIITSQTIPILAIAPMVILVLDAVGIRGLLPKALISMYLSFFPVTVGMVKGLRSPDKMHLDLLRTYNGSAWQTFWKLRWPSSLPFLFTSMKVAIAISLIGAIVGELPTGAVAGLGARLLSGSYYGQTVLIWSALLMAAFCAAMLVALVGVAEKWMRRRMGEKAEAGS
ncbi:MAG: ABC transporter permease [Alphaproteobacteria bacterium]